MKNRNAFHYIETNLKTEDFLRKTFNATPEIKCGASFTKEALACACPLMTSLCHMIKA